MRKLFILLAVVLAVGSQVTVAQQWKGRTKRSSGDGGIIKIVSGTTRANAETTLGTDPEASGETVVDIEKLDSNEASYRGMATQATLATVSTDVATMANETTLSSNSSTTPLAGSATFTGSYQSCANAEAVRVSIITNQDSASNGLVISWSSDGTDTVATETFTVTTAGFLETFPARAAYVRVAYTNGAVAQAIFELTTVKLGRNPHSVTTNTPIATRVMQSNGTSMEVATGNRSLTLLSSASRTTSVNSNDVTNYNNSGAHVVVNVTATGGGDITVSIQGKDELSGAYYTLLSSASITTTGTTVLRVFPGADAVANQTANDIVPRVWRVSVTANNASPITYSVGASLVK